MKEKGSFIEIILEKDLNVIKKLYSSIGYNFAEVEAKSKKLNEDKLDLIFDIKRGNKTKIGQITFYW